MKKFPRSRKGQGGPVSAPLWAIIWILVAFAFLYWIVTVYGMQLGFLSSTQCCTLKIDFTGFGSGTVTLDPPGKTCSSDCSVAYFRGAKVNLTEVQNADSIFSGWSHEDCVTDITNLRKCTVTMNASKTIHVDHSTQYPLTINIVGLGAVSTSVRGFLWECNSYTPSPCFWTIDSGTTLDLNALPMNNYVTFVGWGDDCGGMSTQCTITMDRAKIVTAEFAYSLETQPLSINIVGPGSVQISYQNSAGAAETRNLNACSTEPCIISVAEGTTASLFATPDPYVVDNNFAGWGDGCASFGTATSCDITMDANRFVTATFTAPQLASPTTLTVTKSPANSPETITSSDGKINCGATCSAQYTVARQVTLQVAVPSNREVVWSGCASTVSQQSGDGYINFCTISTGSNKEVGARFFSYT